MELCPPVLIYMCLHCHRETWGNFIFFRIRVLNLYIVFNSTCLYCICSISYSYSWEWIWIWYEYIQIYSGPIFVPKQRAEIKPTYSKAVLYGLQFKETFGSPIPRTQMPGKPQLQCHNIFDCIKLLLGRGLWAEVRLSKDPSWFLIMPLSVDHQTGANWGPEAAETVAECIQIYLDTLTTVSYYTRHRTK
jgi:hypothetical protein